MTESAPDRSWAEVLATPSRKKQETADLLDAVRAGCSSSEERVQAAATLKEEANSSFSAGDAGLALRSYLACLWLLRADLPPLFRALSEPETPGGSSLVAALTPAPSAASLPEAEGAATSALRTTVRLNIAAAALQLGEWAGARAACSLVLADAPAPVQAQKALFRLARAHEGAGELGAALDVLGKLLRDAPENREAARLAAAIRARAGHERKMYGGLFERARAEGGGSGGGGGEGSGGDGDGDGEDDGSLYSEAALRAEARSRKEERERLFKLENLAKLPTEMWAEQLGGETGKQLAEKLRDESRELAHDMPDTAWQTGPHLVHCPRRAPPTRCAADRVHRVWHRWQKHMAMMSPEALATARAAADLHRAQLAAREAGDEGEEVELEADGEGEGGEEGEEEEEAELWIDKWVDRAVEGLLSSRLFSRKGLAVAAAGAVGAVGAAVGWSTSRGAESGG